MAASGVGQFSINVKSNLKDFYGELSRSKKTMDQLVTKKYQLEIDSKQLNELRDKAQRIAGEMRELRQQKTEIKLGIKEVENADAEIKNLDKRLASLNRQKLAVEADIQPIRTANAELYKVENEIDRINAKKVKIDVSESIKNVGNSVNKMGDGILKAFNPLTSKLNQMLGFGLVNNLVGKGLNMISSSVDGAISRVDTLNNYTKVMSNLNISQEEADKSRQRLVSGLEGLPTTLDKGVAAVQRFTSGNSDIQKSTEMFLALNNALLAGGADQNIQASALEQISQAYSKGKPDMVEWRSLLTAMPAQVAQVAQSFGVSSDELGESLRNGDRSMDEFMQRIIEMNTTGADGFKSFTEQAKNAVDGVQTGVSRMNTAVTRGVAKIITTVDEIGKSRGLGGISDMLGKIGSFFEKGLGSIADTIVKNQDAIFGFIDSTVKFLSSFDYDSFFKGLVSGMKEMGDIAKSVFNFTKPLFSLLGNGDVAEGLGKLIPRMLLFGGALKVAGLGLKVFGVGSKGIGGVFSILSKFKGFKIPSFNFGEGKGKFTTPFQNISVEQLKSIGLKLGIIAGLSANVYLAAKAIQEVTKIENMDGIYGKLASIAVAVTGMGLITIAVDKVSKLAGTSMLTGLLAIAAIAGEIYLMTLSLEKLSNVDIEFVDIQKKIGTIALVIGEMALLSGVIGAVMGTGIGAAAITVGIVTVVALAGELMLLAETMKQIDEKVPSDFGNVDRKISNVISTLSMIVKSQLSSLTTLFDSIVTGFTTGSIIKTLDNIIVISDKLKELNTEGSAINSQKTNKIISSIKSTLDNLSLEGGFWSSVGQAFKRKADSAVYNNAIDSLDKIILLSGRVKTLEDILLNSEKVQKNINAIQKILPLIDVKNFSDNTFNPVKPKFVDSIDTTIYYIIKLFGRIKDLETMSIDITKAQNNIVNVKGFARMLKADKWEELNDGLVNKNLLKNLEEAIYLLSNVNKQMNVFIESIPENGKAQDALINIRGSLRMLKSEKWDEFKDGYVTSNLLMDVVETLKTLGLINKSLFDISNNSVETGVIQEIIVNIKGALRMLKLSNWGEFSEGFVDKNLIEPSIESLKVILDLSEKLYDLSNIGLEIGKAQNVIVNLKGAMRMLKAESWIEYQSGFVDRNFLEPLTLSLDVIEEIGQKLKVLAGMELDPGKANDTLAALRGVLRMLVNEKWTEYDSGFVDKNLIEPVTLALDVLKVVGEKLQAISSLNIEGISKKINDEIAAIKGCLRMMRADSWIDFQSGFIETKTLEQALAALMVLQTITDKLSELQPLKAHEVNNNIAKVKGLLRSLKAEKWDEFVDSMVNKEDLQKYAELIDPLKNAISKMAEIKNDEINIAGIQKNITAFMGLMRRITLDNFPQTENLISSETLDKATSTIDSLVIFGTKLPTLGNIEFSEGAVISRLSSMKRIIDTMNEFSYENGMQNAASLIQVFIDMANKMVEMSSTTFQPIGKSWGERVVQGFKESNVPKQILTIVDSLVSKLNKKVNIFKNIGTSWGNALKNSFNSSVQGIGNGIDNQINSLQSKTEIFSRLGNEYGRYLNDGFNNALILLDNSISSRVSKLSQLTNSSQPTNNSSNTNSSRPRPVVLASGGKVYSPSGYSRIVDSPEQPILQNGEGVVPKKIMDKIGMPFFEQLRRGQVSPTFANLGRSISNTTSSVVNNIYNNTTTNQQMNMYTTAAPDAIKIINRRLR
ncbi:tape measure protein [Enterococcus sp. AZ177]|uniref:tape measure protein n=1 Tax=unclassified Enterococcus TaxID=2608891 RepID=UPI003D301615